MPGADLLRCVAGAVVSNGVPGLLQEVPFGNVLYQIAADALTRWRELRKERALRDEVEALAREGVEDAKRVAAEVAREVAAGQPAGVELALELYLSQVPAAIRRTLARPDDPTGTTLPAGVGFDRPDDLLALLPARPPRFRPGDRPACLRGEWELVELLGTGGFGEVWKGRHVDSPALASAFKFCLDPAAQDRLLKHEAAVLSQVQQHREHPGIVPLRDFSLRGETPWLRYEYVAGGDLSRAFADLRGRPAGERVARAVAVLRELAAVAGYFHRLSPPVVHRDLKPSNILLSGGSVRVADFGIGMTAGTGGGPTPGASGVTILGRAYTAHYASPQQRRGEAPDPRDDVHALGVIGYQLVLGRADAEIGPDFDEDLRAAGVPAEVVGVLKRCVARDAARRPADGAELAELLGHPPDQGTTAPRTTDGSTHAHYYVGGIGLLVVLVSQMWVERFDHVGAMIFVAAFGVGLCLLGFVPRRVTTAIPGNRAAGVVGIMILLLEIIAVVGGVTRDRHVPALVGAAITATALCFLGFLPRAVSAAIAGYRYLGEIGLLFLAFGIIVWVGQVPSDELGIASLGAALIGAVLCVVRFVPRPVSAALPGNRLVGGIGLILLSYAVYRIGVYW